MFLFLLLSLLSGVLEIGVILRVYAAGKPMWEILLMGSMYQLGNLLFFPGKIKWYLLQALGILNVCLGLVNLYWDNSVILALQVVLSSLGIQAARAWQKGSCPTWLKRMFRIGGFLLAPLMTIYPREMMLLCAILPLGAVMGSREGRDVAEEAILGKTISQEGVSRETIPGETASRETTPGEAISRRVTTGKGVSVTMIFHQMHYFVYTYSMLLAVLGLTHNPYLGAALYALTWVVYLLPGLAADKKKEYNPRILFLIGHLLLAVVMGGLTAAFLTGNLTMGFWAWMLTGLGGGSVFCIGRLTEKDRTCNMTLSENIGHFAGALVPVLVSLAAGPKMYALLTALSGLFVCMALTSAVVGIRQEERRRMKDGQEGQ